MDRCRLCYCYTNLKFAQNIFNTKLDPPIWKIIKQLSNLTIEKRDPYTKIVCFQCFDELKKVDAFRQKILDTDHRIRYEKLHLSRNKNNNYDDFDVDSLKISQEIGGYGLKQEIIEIDEDPLSIEYEDGENYTSSKSHINTNNRIDFDLSNEYHSISARNNCASLVDNDDGMVINNQIHRNTTKDTLHDLDRIECNVIKQETNTDDNKQFLNIDKITAVNGLKEPTNNAPVHLSHSPPTNYSYCTTETEMEDSTQQNCITGTEISYEEEEESDYTDPDLFGKDWPEDTMVKLVNKIYCKQSDLKLVESLCTQASHVVRRLITGVFKPSGYLNATFTGQAPRAQKNKQKSSYMKPLNQVAKDEIIDYAMKLAERKKWVSKKGISQTREDLQRAMSQRIGELKRSYELSNGKTTTENGIIIQEK